MAFRGHQGSRGTSPRAALTQIIPLPSIAAMHRLHWSQSDPEIPPDFCPCLSLHSTGLEIYYIGKVYIQMRIDAFQSQVVNQTAVQPRQEVAGEREPDADADDMTAKVAKTAQQITPQGVGTKVDLFA